MILRLISLISLVLSSIMYASDRAIRLDTVVATIFAPAPGGKGIPQHRIIYASDLDSAKKRLDGTPAPELWERVAQELLMMDPLAPQVVLSDAQVQERVEYIRTANNMTNAQMEKLFEQLGYDKKGAYHEVRRMALVSSLFEFYLGKYMQVSEQDVEAYAKKNPQYLPASFDIEILAVRMKDATDITVQQLEDAILQGLTKQKHSFTLTEDELADSMQFIKKLTPGDIIDVQPDADGLEVTRLIAYHPQKAVDWRTSYNQIAEEIYNARRIYYENKYYLDLLQKHRQMISFLRKEDELLFEQQIAELEKVVQEAAKSEYL